MVLLIAYSFSLFLRWQLHETPHKEPTECTARYSSYPPSLSLFAWTGCKCIDCKRRNHKRCTWPFFVQSRKILQFPSLPMFLIHNQKLIALPSPGSTPARSFSPLTTRSVIKSCQPILGCGRMGISYLLELIVVSFRRRVSLVLSNSSGDTTD